jgi:aminoglycoside/choline kinase family phosphotransferase
MAGLNAPAVLATDLDAGFVLMSDLGTRLYLPELRDHTADALYGDALHALVRRLDDRGFTLLDTQWTTDHLSRFGAHEIPRSEYLRRLKRALALPCRFVDDPLISA